MSVIKAKITGWPPSKANSRRLIRPGLVIKSDKALLWSEQALWALKKHQGAFKGNQPLKLTLIVYYENWRPDLDIELVCDVLQKAGVIDNDRNIVEKHVYRRHDRNFPKTEIIIESLALTRDEYVKQHLSA